MKFIIYLSDYIMPFIIFYIIGLGLLTKTPIYDEFIKGAKEGFKVVIDILPTLIGLMVAIGILRASGALDILSNLLKPFTERLHFPSELVPIVLVKMFSSSAATSLLLDIYKEYGPDSYLGRLVSIILSSTETIFYTMAVYFMAAGVKKTRYTLVGALVATLVGTIASVIITNLVF
ncbi:spore maturation protein [Herbinix luporum]|jgi:spore maturation protein B|uniref:Putative membrane protein n=1 Tax=Herbinix luporum TaxID=1679721 RepID=A0A0K8J8H2_9FIRM|nr:nucleoside recognition domain-containing protein [Herbinix luporum]MDI9489410.1 nucleoside recognition domain-containing protein [Bacillota bacterium]CUH93895.1 putative membrane protein [Herbinix luporum]HHT56554.1 spore maturation protein [Herbinix luporum]